MGNGLSASTIKSWFQYRCERKVRYELSSDEELAAVPVTKDVREQAWAILGKDFEDRVVQRLSQDVGVLMPAPGDRGLSERLASAFLRGLRPEAYATQLNLRTRETPGFIKNTGLTLARTYPDLIRLARVSGRLHFTVIDIKATRRATPFHKTQVAFYVRVLEESSRNLGSMRRLIRSLRFGEYPTTERQKATFMKLSVSRAEPLPCRARRTPFAFPCRSDT